MGIYNAQAVWLGDKLYMGGGEISLPRSKRDKARLYVYSPTADTWSHIDTPVYYFALITYHSQLVLIGGKVYISEWKGGRITNKLWTWTEHDQWRETLPPMTKNKHKGASAVEYADNILVAGGMDDNWNNNIIDIVEVYNGHHWARAQCLPKPYNWMKSTVLNGHWYLMGGGGRGKKVYYASLDSLVASCQPSEKPLPSVWKRLPDVPHRYFSIALFGNRLITVGRGRGNKSLIAGGGGGYPSSSSIHAYSFDTESWVHVGDVPVGFSSTCTAVLPTGELMVIGDMNDASDSCVHKASLNGNC